MSTVGQLTVVLGADARDFTTAIAGVKASVKGLQPELETVSSGPLARFKKALTMQESRAGSEGLRVLRAEMTNAAAQALGTTSSMGKLGESFLSLGIGGPWGLAILGGAAAIGLAMKALGDSSEQTAKQIQTGMELAASVLKLPKWVEARDQLAGVGLAASELREHSEDLQKAIDILHNRTDSFAVGLRNSYQRQLDETTAKLRLAERAMQDLADTSATRLSPEQERARANEAHFADQLHATGLKIVEQRIQLQALAEHWGPTKLAGALAFAEVRYAGVSDGMASATRRMVEQNIELEKLIKNFGAQQLLNALPGPAAQLRQSNNGLKGNPFAPVTALTFGQTFGADAEQLGLLIAAAESAQSPLARLQTEFGGNLAMLQKFQVLLGTMDAGHAIAELERLAGKADLMNSMANAAVTMGQAFGGITGINVAKMLGPLGIIAKVYAAFELAQGVASLAAAIFSVGGPNPAGIAAAAKHFEAARQFGTLGGGGGGSSGGGGAGSMGTGGNHLGVMRPSQENQGTVTVIFPGKKVFDPSDPAAQDAFATFVQNITQRNLVIRTDGGSGSLNLGSG